MEAFSGEKEVRNRDRVHACFAFCGNLLQWHFSDELCDLKKLLSGYELAAVPNTTPPLLHLAPWRSWGVVGFSISVWKRSPREEGRPGLVWLVRRSGWVVGFGLV